MTTTLQVLERLQTRLQAQLNIGCGPLDHLAHIASRGSGPRVFCGHVPPGVFFVGFRCLGFGMRT